ncbi:MAG: hypothetical protein K2M43_02115 [Mycoplasmoidaceae bacterium]|nr:hypothetical protein [Mycoplasmoidaceae bacterium]
MLCNGSAGRFKINTDFKEAVADYKFQDYKFKVYDNKYHKLIDNSDELNSYK